MAEVPGAASAKPSVDSAAASRVMRQVLASNKVAECDEMWAARRLQQAGELDAGRWPARRGGGGASERRATSEGAVASLPGTSPRNPTITPDLLREAREAARQRKLRAASEDAARVERDSLGADGAAVAEGARPCSEGTGRSERKRRKRERKEAKSERKAAKMAKRRRRASSDSSSSSGGR